MVHCFTFTWQIPFRGCIFDFIGGWPGIQATSTIEDNSVTYEVYTIDNDKLPMNLIYNNNGGGSQLEDYYIDTAEDLYLVAYTSGLQPAGTAEPTFVTYHAYVNNTTGWDTFYLYAWGDKDAFGAWPGMTIPASAFPCKLIFNNNNNGSQLPDYTLTTAADYYLIAQYPAMRATDYTPQTHHLYVRNLTDWDTFDSYIWGTYEALGAWPVRLSLKQALPPSTALNTSTMSSKHTRT
ncbi:MAG: hypothetical protein IJS00_04220 [Paludibacteraceae bacterium]|nr:hypothetical protein [Paludibacteraceae bacterium]